VRLRRERLVGVVLAKRREVVAAVEAENCAMLFLDLGVGVTADS
jgi:hypothetical protein